MLRPNPFGEIDAWCERHGWTDAFGPLLARAVWHVAVPSGRPKEPLTHDACFRLGLVSGHIVNSLRRVPSAEVVSSARGDDLSEACGVAFLCASGTCWPMLKKERALVPLFGMRYDAATGRALPIARVVNTHRDPWTDELLVAALDPFTGKRFTVAGMRGECSPDRAPPDWRGSGSYWLA